MRFIWLLAIVALLTLVGCEDGLVWTSADGSRWVTPEDPSDLSIFQLGGPETEEVRSVVAMDTLENEILVAFGTSGDAPRENAEIWVGTSRAR